MSKFFGKPTEKIIEFLLFFVIYGCLWGSILETQGSMKTKNKSVFLVTFLGWGPGGFWDAFWMLSGSFLVIFWKPLGAGLLELLGSSGKDLKCFFCFFPKQSLR